MRRLLLSLMLIVSMATAATARDMVWKGPGWYVEFATVFGVSLLRGPYASEGECERMLPKSTVGPGDKFGEGDIAYGCGQYDTNPDE